MWRSAEKSSSGAFRGSRNQVIAIFHSLLAVFLVFGVVQKFISQSLIGRQAHSTEMTLVTAV